jgi:hypothetical protein
MEASKASFMEKPLSPMTDAEKAAELIDELHDVQQAYLENSLKLLDKTFKVNENGASFYEKLALFDIGTIAFSLTLLGQIVAHSVGGHVPRHPFLWFLCPAWLLLLISIQCCAQQIIGFHNANSVLTQQMANVFSDNRVQQMRALFPRLSAVIGKLALNEEQAQQFHFAVSPDANAQNRAKTLSEVFSNMNEALAKATNEETGKVIELLNKANEQSKKVRIAARIGILATTLALLLICIFAIQSILGI